MKKNRKIKNRTKKVKNFIKTFNIFAYFRTLVNVAKAITWPTKKELLLYSVAVLIISVIITAYLLGLDYIFNIIKLNYLFK